MSTLILRETKLSEEIAVIEDGQLVSYFLGDADDAIAPEQIYLSVVDRVVKGMSSAFVKINKHETGFLPFTEIPGGADSLRSGDKMLVQVRKAPVGNKAAYVSHDISLAGHYVLLLPFSQKFGVSKRIENADQRSNMLFAARSLAPENMGLVMRAESADAEECLIREEIDELSRTWQTILETVKTADAPCRVSGEIAPINRIVRDCRDREIAIITDSIDGLKGISCPVKIEKNPFQLYGIRDKLQKTLRRHVWLPCGGYLVIDPCEAMTVIDINSGKFLGGKAGAEDMILRLNLEAAEEIPRVLRLRAISGIIVIDFVDMQEEAHRERVLHTLKEQLMKDPAKTVVHGFTSLGLLEMTRKRTGEARAIVPEIPCPVCHGLGVVPEETDS